MSKNPFKGKKLQNLKAVFIDGNHGGDLGGDTTVTTDGTVNVGLQNLMANPWCNNANGEMVLCADMATRYARVMLI